MKYTSRNTPENIQALEKTAEQSNSSIFFTDLNGNISFVNPAFVRNSGYSTDEVIGKNPRIFKSGKQSAKVYQELWDKIQEGGTWFGTLQNRCKDGTLVWENVTIFPVFDENNEISQFVCIKENLTEQKRDESILRCAGEINQKLLRAGDPMEIIHDILESIGLASDADRAYLFRYEGPISAPTEGFIRLESEWHSETCSPLFENPDNHELSTSEGLLHEWIESLTSGFPVTAKISGLPDGEHQLMSSQQKQSTLLVPVFKGKNFYGFLGFCDCSRERDWSEAVVSLLSSVAGNLGIVLQRKNYEKEIKDALSKAESSALDAIRANTAKSAFLATMSHEIRTPLNGILGMTQILLDEEMDTEKRDFLQTIYNNSENLDSLLSDVIDFSKADVGKLDFISKEFSFQTISSEVYQLFLPIAEEKGLELSLSLAPTMPEQVFGDPERIRQILSNLVSNALKFTEVGKVSIHAEVKEGCPRLLLIEVEDTGIGIDADAREHIFQMFTQADSTDTRRFGGAGLGLAICRRLVEAMKGRIWFESTPSKGSRFSIEIPCSSKRRPHIPSGPGWETIEDNPSEETLELTTTEPQKILVVEDNKVNQRITKIQLQSLGYFCETSDDGPSAIERFKNGEEFDAVLMDCQMPGMNGFEAAEAILNIANPAPHVIALTASKSAIDQKRAMEIGMKEYLVKPVPKERMHSAIQDVFRS